MSPIIFDNDLVAKRKIKVTLKLNKVAFVVRCVLDLSKVLMYQFQYYYIKNKYGNKSEVLFTYINSLMYKNIFEDFGKDKVRINV